MGAGRVVLCCVPDDELGLTYLFVAVAIVAE